MKILSLIAFILLPFICLCQTVGDTTHLVGLRASNADSERVYYTDADNVMRPLFPHTAKHVNFSTTEDVTNESFEGQQLYTKTFTFSSSGTTNAAIINLGTIDAYKVVKVKGYTERNNTLGDIHRVFFPGLYSSAHTEKNTSNISSLVVSMGIYSGYDINGGKVTIWYYK